MGVTLDLVVLVLFPLIGIAVVAWVADLSDRRVAAWPPPERDWADPDLLTGEQLGLLANGETRAVEAAVARLRVAGAVRYDPAAVALVPTGEPLPEATDLSTAVLIAAADRVPVAELRAEPGVQAALAELRDGLGDAWYKVDMPPRHFVVVGLPVIGYGLAGLGWALIAPFRWYTDVPMYLMAGIAIILGLAGLVRPDTVPLPAARAVDRARKRHDDLHPRRKPALTTYGPAAAATAVGLFGLGALQSVDPGLAVLSFRSDVEPEEDDDPDDRFVVGCASVNAG
ncbi:TIGR04222 domain-containing membrane protein [Virgisporangium aurantiacum]|uniref:TIGR04222 domain-containing protein n=1 Tax=Virgisporangium aurantiacum TaxID=175570 RepID=A0A8J3ZC73_9ACTN|nr:TIGR04222 domain-containing membrane protein [Virgisporangium aurantiacum]GIJ58971.1 hypothetical protein Vau01_064870 [Virgisporangium aurantiacum]